jgi:hypothetical protein
LSLGFYTAAEYSSSHCQGRRDRQRRNEAEHGFAVSTMREKGDEDDASQIFWNEGLCWAVMGCGFGPAPRAVAGLLRQVRSGKPLFLLLSIFILCFLSLFYILFLIQT